MSNEVVKKAIVATKWSALSEIISKCISPVTTMILARILAPEAFGVLATVQMVIAFAEVFVDSSFQKYLIHYQFKDETEEHQYMSVAFWANLAIALFIWAVISIFNAPIASLVGDAGKGNLLIIMGVTIPLYSIIGIQNCKIKKDLNFKKLFVVRIVSATVPLFVTIPLALIGLNYWALVIGNIAGVVVRMLILSLMKSFKPLLFFSFKYLSKMLNYSIWTLTNGVFVWLVAWVDTFLIGRFLNDYYIGIYKNSISFITTIFAIVTAAITPVLFSSLSKLQNDDDEFKRFYLGIQRAIALLIIPMGVGLFFYRSFATSLFFGKQWTDAINVIGINALTMAFRTLFVSLNGDVFRAKGHFKTPLFIELIDIVITIPICFYVLNNYGFMTFVYTKALLRLLPIIPEFIMLGRNCKIDLISIFKNIGLYFGAAGIMGGVAFVCTEVGNSLVWSVVSIILCAIVYFAIILCVPKERHFLVNFVKKTIRKNQK